MFEPGNVVSLKSGGPAMTIGAVSGPGAFCVYYNNITGLFEKLTFDVSLLKFCRPDPFPIHSHQQDRL